MHLYLSSRKATGPRIVCDLPVTPLFCFSVTAHLDVQDPYFFPNACSNQPVCQTETKVLYLSQVFTDRYSTAMVTSYS